LKGIEAKSLIPNWYNMGGLQSP